MDFIFAEDYSIEEFNEKFPYEPDTQVGLSYWNDYSSARGALYFSNQDDSIYFVHMQHSGLGIEKPKVITGLCENSQVRKFFEIAFDSPEITKVEQNEASQYPSWNRSQNFLSRIASLRNDNNPISVIPRFDAKEMDDYNAFDNELRKLTGDIKAGYVGEVNFNGVRQDISCAMNELGQWVALETNMATNEIGLRATNLEEVISQVQEQLLEDRMYGSRTSEFEESVTKISEDYNYQHLRKAQERLR